MKKMDEMNKNILLRAQALGYKCILIFLSLWTFFTTAIRFLPTAQNTVPCQGSLSALPCVFRALPKWP